MSTSLLRHICATCAVAAIVGLWSNAAAAPRPKVQKAHVRFLATSTVVRASWGGNEDVYLAELRAQDAAEPVLVRLVDAYPSAYAPLSRDALTADGGTSLRIRRDAQCDLPYSRMILRTPPGSPMAILHERLGYQPNLTKVPDPGEIIPCYRTARFR